MLVAEVSGGDFPLLLTLAEESNELQSRMLHNSGIDMFLRSSCSHIAAEIVNLHPQRVEEPDSLDWLLSQFAGIDKTGLRKCYFLP